MKFVKYILSFIFLLGTYETFSISFKLKKEKSLIRFIELNKEDFELKSPDIDFQSANYKLHSETNPYKILETHNSFFTPSYVRQLNIDENAECPIIEDYSDNEQGLALFIKALEQKNSSSVKIGFIGDSFVEGDILTCDIREILQNSFGGSGVGFVPTTSVASGFRGTIKHSYSGWETYNIKKKNSEIVSDKFLICSFHSSPKNNAKAKVSYELTNYKENLDSVKNIRYFFISESNSTIRMNINDSLHQTFTTKATKELQSISISLEDNYVKTLEIEIDASGGFYSYGASFENDKGIYLDNFSDRGSSGMQLTKLSTNHGRKFGELIDGYSLIVLQYGLNVMYKGRKDYTYYENKMVEVVEKLKTIYPNASILIMGISDRKIREGGVYKTMSEIAAMEEHQRSVAKRTGVLYWSTYDAMQNCGGIEEFVEKGWAAKDHIHINYKGARAIAEQFVQSLYKSLSETR